MYHKIDDISAVIRQYFNRVQQNPHELNHLLQLDEQLPEISFTVCKKSKNPFQMFDEYYFRNGFRINKHSIIIPEYIIKKILDENFHNGISVLEYTDYTGSTLLNMKREDYITAIAVHELSHVFQLYIQDYYTEEDHTEEFYDVLEGFYASSIVTDIKSDIARVLMYK